MSYTNVGFWVDKEALREFAAAQNPAMPPREAVKVLYDYCREHAEEMDMEDIFTDFHSGWLSALDEAARKLGLPEPLRFSDIMNRKEPPFPYPYAYDHEVSFGYLSAADARIVAETLADAEKLVLDDPNADEIKNGLTVFRKLCGNAVETGRDMIFFGADYLEEDGEETEPAPESPAIAPYLGHVRLLATITIIPGILYYLGALQIGPLSCGNLSINEFAEKWRSLFEMEIGYFLIFLPCFLYFMILMQIWGKFSGVIKKRLWLGALLLLFFSYITLYKAFPGLIKWEGMTLLLGGIVIWCEKRQ
ncbi:MAG: hypothetical protein BWY31_03975 [Lentisphaerae bacterium ADurb.Bin242]|nr:MAG: hypothetical protein BWY31_03975 [Lentisphaerae bacterium ADurb.Bin242]